jgi:hypothetical protein
MKLYFLRGASFIPKKYNLLVDLITKICSLIRVFICLFFAPKQTEIFNSNEI